MKYYSKNRESRSKNWKGTIEVSFDHLPKNCSHLCLFIFWTFRVTSRRKHNRFRTNFDFWTYFTPLKGAFPVYILDTVGNSFTFLLNKISEIDFFDQKSFLGQILRRSAEPGMKYFWSLLVTDQCFIGHVCKQVLHIFYQTGFCWDLDQLVEYPLSKKNDKQKEETEMICVRFGKVGKASFHFGKNHF